MAPVITGLLALGVLVWSGIAYNRLTRLRNQVRAAWADIDVQLKRRHDLVPQLVGAVKGYANHEDAVLQAVTALRVRAVGLHEPNQVGEAETALTAALQRVCALQETYPELRASDAFRDLQRDLVGVEEQLQYARRFYNGAVRDYNNCVQRVPDAVIARGAGFASAEYFQATEQERAAVSVKVAS